MRPSRIRYPYRQEGTLVRIRDPHWRVDYCLRVWPKPASYRRDWHDEHWTDGDPPLEAWSEDAALGRRGLAKRRTGGRCAAEGQLPLDLDRSRPRVIRGGPEEFWAAVPDFLRSIIQRLPACQWPVLRMVAEGERAQDLLRSNPALAVLLTGRGIDAALDEQTNATKLLRDCLLKVRQHDSLAELGFPGSRSFRRLTQRIPPEAATIRRLLELRRVARHRELDGVPVQHLPRLHTGVLALLADDIARPHTHPRLLHALAESEDELSRARTVDLLRDSVLMLRRLRRPHERFRPQSLEGLRTVHQELSHDLLLQSQGIEHRRFDRERARRRGRARVRRVVLRSANAPARRNRLTDAEIAEQAAKQRAEHERLRQLWARGDSFGPPPFEETQWLRWVGSEKELRSAARRLRNCAASYRDDCFAGDYAIYEITGDHEGMIALHRAVVRGKSDAGEWTLHQARGARNQELPESLMERVKQWCLENGVSLR